MSARKIRRGSTLASPDRGTKRQCSNCGTKFYDLNRDPVLCPNCGTVFVIAAARPNGRPRPEAPVKVEPKVEEVEVDPAAAAAVVVPLDEVEEAEEGAEEVIPEVEGVEEAENIGVDDENTFLEEEEDDPKIGFDVPVGKVEER